MKQNKYHVTYFYLATGMEGRPDTKDYGIVVAEDEEGAKNIVTTLQEHKEEPGWTVKQLDSWFKSCLSAKLIE